MLFVVTNRLLCGEELVARVEKIAQGKPKAILLREKDLPEKEYALLAQRCKEVCDAQGVPLIINSHISVAAQLGTPIHLPLPLFLEHHSELAGFSQIGVSVHSPEEAQMAQKLGATYLMAGHIYPTDCKKGLPPRGVEFLKKVCAATTLPVYAIGGIGQEKVPEVLSCKAAGFCIMSEMMTCEDPKGRVEQYQKIARQAKGIC